MTTTVSALYDDYAAAKSAVADLESAGISRSDISVVANNVNNRYVDDRPSNAAADAGAGAGVGAVVGGGAGLLTGLGLMAIPGVGPVVAAGWLVATLAGAATGAVVGGTAGGIIGAMTEAGVDERDAHFYAEGVRRGGTLVAVRTDEARVPAIRDILERHGHIDTEQRAALYRRSGWRSFDETRDPYTAAEIAAERDRLR
jgi:hypothetical protein